jgi:hypothetical protein
MDHFPGGAPTNRRLRQIRPENRLTDNVRPTEFGHTREEGIENHGDPFTRRGVHGLLGDEPRHAEPLCKKSPDSRGTSQQPRVESKEVKKVH